MLSHVVSRVEAVPGIAHVVVAVPTAGESVYVVHAAKSVAYSSDRAESDVLGRFADAAEKFRADAVVRVTADCPLWAPDLGATVLNLYRLHPHYAEVPDPYYVDGMDVEVFSRAMLAEADSEAADAYDREHVTPWMQRQRGFYRSGPRVSRLKLSVDEQSDLERVRRIMAHVKGLNFADTLAACAEAGV
jgi:spore coat polysaccharide biosynthesis protein SpsF (cytidylyltransferase family)